MSTSFWIPNNRSAFYLLLLACLCSVSCNNYRYFPLSYHGVKTIDSTKVQMYIVDNEHVLTNIWLVKDYKFNKNDITCTLEKMPEQVGGEIIKTTSKEEAELNKNKVFLFAKPALTEKIVQHTSITFDYHELDRIQVIEDDHDKTISESLIYILGTVAGVGLALLSIIFVIAIFLLNA